MSIKSILCVFDGMTEELGSLNMALALAKFHEAQLRILHITPPITASMEGIIASGMIVDAIEEDNKTRLKNAKEHTVHYTALQHVPLDAADTPRHHASAKFIHRTATIEEAVSHEGRMSDLLVISRRVSGMSILYDDAAMTALFATGRPVLVAPETKGSLPSEWRQKTIVFPWNNSLEAARALYNAMPFVEKAEKVHVLIAHSPEEPGSVTGQTEIMEYLHAHGVNADVTMIDRGRRTAAEALLVKAHELKADLIVMGAYGHTRAREMILGGVTRYMLKNADVPLLLSH